MKLTPCVQILAEVFAFHFVIMPLEKAINHMFSRCYGEIAQTILFFNLGLTTSQEKDRNLN